MDEAWIIAIPMYFAVSNFSVHQFSIASTLVALGDISGLLLTPYLLKFLTSRKLH